MRTRLIAACGGLVALAVIACAAPTPSAVVTPSATAVPPAVKADEPTRWPLTVTLPDGTTYKSCLGQRGQTCVMPMGALFIDNPEYSKLSSTVPPPGQLLVWLAVPPAESPTLQLVAPDGQGGARSIEGTDGTIPAKWLDGSWLPAARGRVVAGGCSNMRWQPSTSSPIVACVPAGHEVAIMATGPRADGHDWLLVVAPGGFRGWIAADLVQR